MTAFPDPDRAEVNAAAARLNELYASGLDTNSEAYQRFMQTVADTRAAKVPVLHIAQPGDYLVEEDGAPCYVGDGPADAHAFYLDEWGIDDSDWVHPEILRGRPITAADIDSGDCHEDAQVGDTTYEFVTKDPVEALRALGPREVRTWPTGAWRPHWRITPPHAAESGRWETQVAGQLIGSYDTREQAETARDSAEQALVAQWKADHAEYRFEVPDEDDDA